MCTVTYLPPTANHPFIFTVNRDELVSRPTLPPMAYRMNSTKLVFPKDQLAGGSWIAANENGRIACLLNGGFSAHQKQKSHTISRGNVLTEFAASDQSVYEYFAARDLHEVEPFTIVSMEQDKGNVASLAEFVWNGDDKHFRTLDQKIPHTWSSATLYNETYRKLHKEKFMQLYENRENNMTPDEIFAFHASLQSDNDSINAMQGKGELKTVSITQIRNADQKLNMLYADLIHNSNHQVEL